MSFSPARSIDSTMALKSPVDPGSFERRFDERTPTPTPRRDSFSLRDRNHPSVPRQDPQFAPSESDADELDRIAQLNAQYNSVSSASYYTSSTDTTRGEDRHSSSVPHLLDSRGSQARNVPQPTYSNSFVNHSPEELQSPLNVQYTGNRGHAPPFFFSDSDVDRRVSQNPPHQHSDSSSSTTETQSWDSESTQRPSPTLTRQTGPSVPVSAYPQAGYHHRQAADNLPAPAQTAPLSRQRSSYAEHRTSVVGPWPETNISPSTYDSRNRVEFPPLSDSRQQEEYRRDAHYNHSPIPPSSTESVRVYSQLASDGRRHHDSAIRQYEEPVARRGTDQGRANSGISHRDSTFLRERVLSTSYNGAPSNHSPTHPGRSSGDSRRDSHVTSNDMPSQSSASRRNDSRSLDLGQGSSPTSNSPTTRRSSVMFAAAPSRPALPPLDMQAISGNGGSGDRQRTRTNSVSYQARPVDLQRQRSSDVADPALDPHHDQNRRPRHPDVGGVRNSAYEPEARSQGRYSARLSMSYPAPSPGQRPSPSQATPIDTRARPPFPVPRVAAPEPHRRLSDGDRPSTDTPVYPRSATPYERSSGSSRNAVVAAPSAYHPPLTHIEHLRRFSDGDQTIPPRLLNSGRNSAPIGRSVRWMDNLICPSPIIATQRKKGWFNRRGDQLWTNDGQYKPADEGEEYPPQFDDYPEPGQGWMNEEGTRIDLGHRRIPKPPLRSALKQFRG